MTWSNFGENYTGPPWLGGIILGGVVMVALIGVAVMYPITQLANPEDLLRFILQLRS